MRLIYRLALNELDARLKVIEELLQALKTAIEREEGAATWTQQPPPSASEGSSHPTPETR